MQTKRKLVCFYSEQQAKLHLIGIQNHGDEVEQHTMASVRVDMAEEEEGKYGNFLKGHEVLRYQNLIDDKEARKIYEKARMS
jgi:hypothetical protein